MCSTVYPWRKTSIHGSGLAQKLSGDALIGVALGLDARCLCSLATSCVSVHTIICLDSSCLWRTLGARTYFSLGVASDGVMYRFEDCPRLFADAADWKSRYRRFGEEALRTDEDYASGSLCLHCHICTSAILAQPDRGLYFQIDTCAAMGNVFVGLRDRHGVHSVLFEPKQGVVRVIRFAQEQPPGTRSRLGKLKFLTLAALPSMPDADAAFFEGKVGVYLQGNRVAFFRRRCDPSNLDEHCGVDDADRRRAGVAHEAELRTWETTGWISDLLPHYCDPSVCFGDASGGCEAVVPLCTHVAASPPLWPLRDSNPMR